MPITEVLEYVAKVEQDPFVIYTSIEEVYKPNFLEPAVFKKFAHLFDDNAESKFVEQIEAIRASVVEQIALFKVNAATEIDFLRRQNERQAKEICDTQAKFELRCEAQAREANARAREFIAHKE